MRSALSLPFLSSRNRLKILTKRVSTSSHGIGLYKITQDSPKLNKVSRIHLEFEKLTILRKSTGEMKKNLWEWQNIWKVGKPEDTRYKVVLYILAPLYLTKSWLLLLAPKGAIGQWNRKHIQKMLRKTSTLGITISCIGEFWQTWPRHGSM